MIEQRIQDILREKAALDEELQTIRKGLVGKTIHFQKEVFFNGQWQTAVLTGVVDELDRYQYSSDHNAMPVNGAIGYHVELKT